MLTLQRPSGVHTVLGPSSLNMRPKQKPPWRNGGPAGRHAAANSTPLGPRPAATGTGLLEHLPLVGSELQYICSLICEKCDIFKYGSKIK